jgi:UDP-N-acetylmuramate dehydrogenase
MARVRRVELKAFTTLKVGGPAELWEVESVDDLREATAAPYRVLGAGSNLLVADEGVCDRVIRLGRAFNDLSAFGGSADIW